jgi:hypothetical protein
MRAWRLRPVRSDHKRTIGPVMKTLGLAEDTIVLGAVIQPRWATFSPHDVYALRFGVEHDASLSALKLPHDMGNFLLEREFPHAIVGTFSKYEGFDHASKRIGAELRVGYFKRIGRERCHTMTCTIAGGNEYGLCSLTL